jgi:ACT domain-containing protein
MKKAIVTVVGLDTVGIIARVCTYLAENSCNILDISQTITGGYFNMMLITDYGKSEKTFAVIREELKSLGEGIGVEIHVQREELFEKMHRI